MLEGKSIISDKFSDAVMRESHLLRLRFRGRCDRWGMHCKKTLIAEADEKCGPAAMVAVDEIAGALDVVPAHNDVAEGGRPGVVPIRRVHHLYRVAGRDAVVPDHVVLQVPDPFAEDDDVRIMIAPERFEVVSKIVGDFGEDISPCALDVPEYDLRHCAIRI